MGDSNEDGEFNQLDIVEVLQGGKYLSGQPATLAEGDWNGDGVFDQLDIVHALTLGDYRTGAAASHAAADLDMMKRLAPLGKVARKIG